MKLIEIILTQNDCPHIELTNEFSDITIYVFNTVSVNQYEKLFSIFYSINKETLDKALNKFRNNKKVRNFQIISKKNNLAALTYFIIKTAAYKKIETVGFRLHPLTIHNGIEKWFFLDESSNEISYKELLSEFNDENTSIVSILELTTKNFLDEFLKNISIINFNKLDILDDEDKELLSMLIKAGYFEWPRKVSLTYLSKDWKIPKSTISYRIRKLEKSIIRIYSNI
ncbi:MAG: helix-turn-helix domain-containing protein [Thermoplasmata archaeon]